MTYINYTDLQKYLDAQQDIFSDLVNNTAEKDSQKAYYMGMVNAYLQVKTFIFGLLQEENQ